MIFNNIIDLNAVEYCMSTDHHKNGTNCLPA